MAKKFFKTLIEAEDWGLRMGNRWGWSTGSSRITKESPQGFSKPWMTKKGSKGFWVKITHGKRRGEQY